MDLDRDHLRLVFGPIQRLQHLKVQTLDVDIEEIERLARWNVTVQNLLKGLHADAVKDGVAERRALGLIVLRDHRIDGALLEYGDINFTVIEADSQVDIDVSRSDFRK
jgi:hypothetical protein